ncbi:MAG TPA: urease accessory protein UreD [Methylomirabilota bacterium]
MSFEQRGARTVLTERRFTLPLQALEPVDLDGTGAATLFLLNPTGGVLGGDRLETRVELGAGSHVCLSTPSATRVYRSAGPPSIQRLTARVGEGARLEYMPDHVIPSPGARLIQSLDVSLAPGAAAVVCDAWSAGRWARGESWLFHLLDSGIVARDAEGLLFKERVVLDGARGWGGLGGAEGMVYVASVVCLAPYHPRLDGLAEEMAAALTGIAHEARAGVTPLARGGVVARILAPSAPAMQSALEAAWSACRARLWKLPPLLLRKI